MAFDLPESMMIRASDKKEAKLKFAAIAIGYFIEDLWDEEDIKALETVLAFSADTHDMSPEKYSLHVIELCWKALKYRDKPNFPELMAELTAMELMSRLDKRHAGADAAGYTLAYTIEEQGYLEDDFFEGVEDHEKEEDIKKKAKGPAALTDFIFENLERDFYKEKELLVEFTKIAETMKIKKGKEEQLFYRFIAPLSETARLLRRLQEGYGIVYTRLAKMRRELSLSDSLADVVNKAMHAVKKRREGCKKVPKKFYLNTPIKGRGEAAEKFADEWSEEISEAITVAKEEQEEINYELSKAKRAFEELCHQHGHRAPWESDEDYKNAMGEEDTEEDEEGQSFNFSVN